jgi:hypothetical protein
MTAINRVEFYSTCNEKGFLGHLSGPPNYTSIDGSVFANRETGQPYHNGKFHVDPSQNKTFQTLVARALRGGVVLSISQYAEVKEEGKDVLFPAFFDLDIKDVLKPGMTESQLLDVGAAFFNIAAPMLEADTDDVWTRHMMEKKPLFIKDRWPSFKTVRDVLLAFQSNPLTMAEYPAGSTYTLADLFTDNVDAQNWLVTVIAAALAYHIQKVVRQFYPETMGTSKVFDILAMASINGTAKPSSKVGVHIHLFNLVVTSLQMFDMASAVENALVKFGGKNVFQSSVDKAIYSPNVCIRMPFTSKTEKISNRVPAAKERDGGPKKLQQKKSRAMYEEAIYSDDGRHLLVNKRYECVAYIPAGNMGKVDLQSTMGRELCVVRNVLITIQASQLRLDQRKTKPTPGFTCSNMKATDIYTSSSVVPALIEAGYSEAYALAKQAIIATIPDIIDQQNRLNIYVGQAPDYCGKRKRGSWVKPDTARYAYLPPTHKGFVAFKKFFPTILALVFTKRETNGALRCVYNLFTVGSVTVDKENAQVIVQGNSDQSICCYNRKINRDVPHPHNFGNSVQFVMDATTITQKCWNKNKSCNRASGGPCKDWKGHTVNIEKEMMSNLNTRLPGYTTELAKVRTTINRVIPGILKDAVAPFLETLPGPDEAVQSTLDMQFARDTEVAEEAAAAAAASSVVAASKEAAAEEAAVPSLSFSFGLSRSNSSTIPSSQTQPTQSHQKPASMPHFVFGGGVPRPSSSLKE